MKRSADLDELTLPLLHAVLGHMKIKGSLAQRAGFDSGQGRSDGKTPGAAALRRGSWQNENAGMGPKMPFVQKNYR